MLPACRVPPWEIDRFAPWLWTDATKTMRPGIDHAQAQHAASRTGRYRLCNTRSARSTNDGATYCRGARSIQSVTRSFSRAMPFAWNNCHGNLDLSCCAMIGLSYGAMPTALLGRRFTPARHTLGVSARIRSSGSLPTHSRFARVEVFIDEGARVAQFGYLRPRYIARDRFLLKCPDCCGALCTTF